MSSLDNDNSIHKAVPIEAKLNTAKSGVQSLEIGLSILDILIDNHQPMMLKDVAHVAQMHPAKVHRYLVSLIRKDYARQLEDGRYGVGIRLNSLSGYGGLSNQNDINQNNLLERLNLVASEIKDRFHCGVQIAKWFSEGPIIIQSVEPDSPISIITRVGSRMPLTTSATGQLFASYQPESIIKPLVMAEWQSELSVKNNTLSGSTIKDSDDDAQSVEQWQNYTQRLAMIRQQGFATVSGDMLMGINAISLPVLLPKFIQSSHTDMPIEYALTVIGTSEQLPGEAQAKLAQDIQAIAKRYHIG